MAFCSECGSQLPPGGKFCAQCGAAAAVAPSVAPPGTPTSAQTNPAAVSSATAPQPSDGVSGAASPLSVSHQPSSANTTKTDDWPFPQDFDPVATFVGPRSDRYERKWESVDDDNKFSWNWAAFFQRRLGRLPQDVSCCDWHRLFWRCWGNNVINGGRST